MATLHQVTTKGTYFEEFQRVLVMLSNVLDIRIAFLLMEGLREPLKGLFKAFDPPNL